MSSPPALHLEPFAAIDDAVAVTERELSPLVHLEVTLREGSTIDGLRSAVHVAVSREPRAGWFAAPITWRTRELRWVTGGPVEDFLVVVPDTVQFDAVRDRLLSSPMALDRGPLFRIVALAGGDGRVRRLALVMHHALSDALGATEFLLGAVSGASSSVGSVAAEPAVEEPGAPSESTPDTGGVVRAVRELVRRPPRRLATPAAGGPGSGVIVQLERYDLARLRSAADRLAQNAGVRVTVNDVLVAATHLAVDRWTAAWPDPPSISVTVPLAQRTSDGPARLGNFALQGSTVTSAADRRDERHLITTIVAQTSSMKAAGGGSEPSAMANRLASLVPFHVRRLGARAVSVLTRDGVLDSTRVSNLGVLDQGPDSPIDGMWFTPPVRMPQGLNAGVVTVGDRVHVGFRCCQQLWSRSQLQEYIRGFGGVLEELERGHR